MFPFIFAFFDPNEKYVNKVMSIRLLMNNCNVLCFDIYAIPTYENIENNVCLHRIIKINSIMYLNFVLQNMLVFST